MTCTRGKLFLFWGEKSVVLDLRTTRVVATKIILGLSATWSNIVKGEHIIKSNSVTGF